MKKYVHREQPRGDSAEDQKTTEQETKQTPPCNEPLTKAVYDWDHALKIATDALWGDKAILQRLVRRK